MKAASFSAVTLLFSARLFSAGAAVAFSKDVQPILQNSCWKCHGSAMQLSKLDLRTRDSALKGGEHGPSIVPGNAAQSRLVRMISGEEKPAMPMGGALSPDQIATLRSWIDQGAVWDAAAPVDAKTTAAQVSALEDMPIPPEARKYWAFQKPVRPPVPSVAQKPANPIDAFLLRAMEQHGLKPAPPADNRTLVRRAYMDLTGLPPSPAETEAFVNDRAADAWPKLIDRLLASPHYGERWGRHWLDVARYADSNGFEHDFNRPNAWRYRDYVIRAFNNDTPYNAFLKEQIAGDELTPITQDNLIATGFLRNHAKVGFREKDNPQFRFEYLDDMIATIGRGVLGMTVQCARCHNHKFDPIPQKDYYRMQAALFSYVEVDHPLTTPQEAAEYQRQVDAIEARLKPLKQQIVELDRPYREKLLPAKYAKFPENIQAAIRTPEAQRTPGQVLLANQVIRTVSVSQTEIARIIGPEDQARKKELQAQLHEIEAQRPPPIPVAMGIADGDYRFAPEGEGDNEEPGKGVKREKIEGSYLFKGPGRYQAPPSYFLFHGDAESPGSRMQPGFLTVATYGNPPTEMPPPDGHTSGRRLALANWLTSPENPLTARVIVNRIWHHHFGRGIVATLDNFGKMGEKPTHPELLDWLAVEFMDRGWSIKRMHRLMMTSDAYRMSSQFGDEGDLARDPDDEYLWRFRIQRLDAEIVRDSILSVSGALNREMGGPAVFPKLPGEVLGSMNKGIWNLEEDGPKVWRRSVYVYRKRGLPFPMFEVFDLPDQNISCGRRNISTVPTQALTLMNDEFVLRQAKLFADRVKEAASPVDAAYEIALSRPPSAEERALAMKFVQTQGLEGLTHVLLNLNEFLYIR
ncbi:MAG: PSD1 and planctomycete cytochrome C domain-containing protein [Bryobacteraceae bacterium]